MCARSMWSLIFELWVGVGGCVCTLNVEPDCYRELMTPTLARHIVNDVYFVCRHFHDFQQRIPRAEMVQLQEIAFRHIKDLDEKFVATVCGSFRRGMSLSEQTQPFYIYLFILPPPPHFF